MEEVSAKMGTGGMLREQWEHGDKGAEHERKGEDTQVLVERERNIHEGRGRKECDPANSNNNIRKTLSIYFLVNKENN